MSKTVQVSPSPCTSKELGLTVNQILDQIIIAPEIMNMILENLDIRSLKEVRLVCKSWLREAQAHMKKRVIVHFVRDGAPSEIQTRMQQEFLELICQTTSRDFAQPFQSLHVELNQLHEKLPHELLQNQLSQLCPPLVITRFLPGKMPLKLALPLIIQCSSSLEYLQLSAKPENKELKSLMSPEQDFSKLRHLAVVAPVLPNASIANLNVYSTHFATAVAWIAQASPNLQVYESQTAEGLSNELLLKKSIQKVKTLTLSIHHVSTGAVNNFVNIQFSQLENLSVYLYTGPNSSDWSKRALVETIKKCTTTLKILDLSDIPVRQAIDFFGNFDFPICPHVQELTLEIFPNASDFIANHFPSLQVLNAGQVFSTSTPFLSLKTLRIRDFFSRENQSLDRKRGEQSVEWRFFKNFPSLERLCVPPSLLNGCCALKATGNPTFSGLLEQVKHLELIGKYPGVVAGRHPDYFPLVALKGIETITMLSFGNAITNLPVKDLRALKVFEFPWDLKADFELEELLKITREVKKVVINNCCSIPRLGTTLSKELLEKFFKAAPNAECGCGELKNMPALKILEPRRRLFTMQGGLFH